VAHGLVATADVEQVEPAFGTVVCDGVGEFFVLLGGNREELVQCVDILLQLIEEGEIDVQAMYSTMLTKDDVEASGKQEGRS